MGSSMRSELIKRLVLGSLLLSGCAGSPLASAFPGVAIGSVPVSSAAQAASSLAPAPTPQATPAPDGPIHAGMGVNDVIAILGQPVHLESTGVYPDSTITGSWKHGAEYDNLTFYRNGIVGIEVSNTASLSPTPVAAPSTPTPTPDLGQIVAGMDVNAVFAILGNPTHLTGTGSFTEVQTIGSWVRTDGSYTNITFTRNLVGRVEVNGAIASDFPSPIAPTPLPSPIPTPTPKPILYTGISGHGLYGPFHLTPGLWTIGYTFKPQSINDWFYAYLDDANGNRLRQVVASPIGESIADSINILIPGEQNFYFELVDAVGAWSLTATLPHSP